VYEKHSQILNEKMDGLLEDLRVVVKNGFDAAQQAYRDDVLKWGACCPNSATLAILSHCGAT
jgi:hypothetical protein